MTYFWAHMVHYFMVQSLSSPSPLRIDASQAIHVTSIMEGTGSPILTDFKLFLLKSPVLVNGGLFLHYYTKQRMLMDAESRTSVLLPDKRPLPSILTDVTTKNSAGLFYEFIC